MNKKLVTNCLGCLGTVALTLSVSALAADVGTIYTMDNAAGANHVLSWARSQDGALTSLAAVDTGGAGNGQGLSSQGAVLLSHDGQWLLVCNAGSDEVSLFTVTPQGPQLVDKVPSGGRSPLSLALRGNLLYVLNAGGLVGDKDNITGFLLIGGKLLALPNSTRELSSDNTGPAQVSFSEDGSALIVTERLSNFIDTFAIGDDGLATEPYFFQSVGATPFGFDVGRGNRLFVSEAAGGAANASSVSSYVVSDDANLGVLDGAVPTEQTAACWVLVSHNGHYVYTTDAGSGAISGYEISPDGSLRLLNTDGRTGVTGDGSHPVDMAQSRDGRFLYSLNNGNGTLSVFRVSPDGSLVPLGTASGVPASAAGLAGW